MLLSEREPKADAWLDELNSQTRKLWSNSNWRSNPAGILPFLFTGFKPEPDDPTFSRGVVGQWLWSGWDAKGPYYEVTVPSLILATDDQRDPDPRPPSERPRIYMDTPPEEVTRLLREGLKILLAHAMSIRT